MTRNDEIRANIKAKANTMTEREAAMVYSAMRLEVMRARMAGQRAPKSLADAMEISGEALEERIGEARFDALIDQIDAHAAAA